MATSGDILSTLVRNCTSDLTVISLIGFQSISDIGVRYAVECYRNSLTSLTLKDCPQVTDRALEGVADWCTLLARVSFNSALNVTDKGVCKLVKHCKKLQCLDLGNCVLVSDKGVVAIADCLCSTLEELNLENCVKLTDLSLSAVILSCRSLKTLDFSGTSITTVPPHIMSLKRLRDVNFSNCGQLDSEMDMTFEQICDQYQQYNVPYR